MERDFRATFPVCTFYWQSATGQLERFTTRGQLCRYRKLVTAKIAIFCVIVASLSDTLFKYMYTATLCERAPITLEIDTLSISYFSSKFIAKFLSYSTGSFSCLYP